MHINRKEKNVFISFSNNCSSLAMRCMYLLSTALLKPWDQFGYHHPHCLAHTELHALLDFYHNDWKASFAKICDIIKRNVAQSNIEILNYLDLVVSTMSRGCQVSLKTFQIAQHTGLSLLQCSVAPWHTVWEPRSGNHSHSLGFWNAFFE